jgi:hypothetical protein
MAGLVPAIHVFVAEREDVDARDKPGHDEVRAPFLAKTAEKSLHFLVISRLWG